MGGVVGAGVFFAASLSPGFLPRPWLVQGVVSGLALAMGYALGSSVDALARPHSDRTDLSTVRGRRILALLGVTGLIAAGVFHVRWQADIRDLMGVEGGLVAYFVAFLSTALGWGYLMVVAGRLLRRAIGAYRRLLGRLVPRGAAVAIVSVTVVAVVVAGYDLVIADRVFPALDRAYLSSILRFDAGVAPPASPLRSGGPGSLITWEGMGRQGRTFVTDGPDPPSLEQFSGEPARMPIRVYAGLQTGQTIAERVQAAVADLERTGAFHREILVLVAPTGTGWVDPYAVDPLEYMYNGDTATVVVQYSHRPSWMVMITNQDLAIQASRALFEAVRDRLQTLSPESRPRVLLYGESLGSFGWEASFPDLEAVRESTDGALWVGPPAMNRLWSRLVAERDPASPLWRPVYGDGQEVRFGPDGEALAAVEGPWQEPRVAYLQHASDPITWLSWDLMFQRPEWLNEPRGPDVSEHMPYLPVVTFWQIVVDLIIGTDAPIGHGHKFGSAQAEAWALIVPPPGWTPHETRALVEVTDPSGE